VKRVAIDTGPIVAFLNRRDSFHAWARAELGKLAPPLYTCEAVISEACFLLRQSPGGAEAVLELVARDLLRVEFRLAEELSELRRSMLKYRSVPMSLADACLVRMAELDPELSVLTLDADFRVYRRNGRSAVPLLTPRR
jgi:uncharacterized protein